MITAMYFSPTKTTKKITEAIAAAMGEFGSIDLTNPLSRKMKYMYGEEDIVVLGYPVYGGRVPQILLEVLGKLSGEGTKAILVAVYGNRAFEDALAEAQDILTAGGFNVVAAGAFIGEHSYSRLVAAGRPDADDIAIAEDFGKKAAAKISAGDYSTPAIPGNRPYKQGMSDMPFKPVTSDDCVSCGICVKGCPMQVIDKADPKKISDGCILCSACVKACPKQAKKIEAEPLAKIKNMLETKFVERKEPEIFL